MKKLLLLNLLFTPFAFAQEDINQVNVDLMSFCKDLSTQVEPVSINDSFEVAQNKAIELEKITTCKRIAELHDAQVEPVVLEKKDEDNNKWRFNFSFGFTKTDYKPTTIHVHSSEINVVIKDVEMVERTSADHYNPATWQHINNAAQWIDEPTNTFTFSMEKNNNVFYLTVYHPKYLKSILYKKTEVDGETQYQFQNIGESNDFSQTITPGYNMMYIGNTHYNMVWQVGAGHRFTLFNTPKAGRLSYIIKGDVGITTGKARSVQIIPGIAWNDHVGQEELQGVNASIGQRLEYKRGIVSIFIDQKVLIQKLSHGFYDGTVDYNLVSVPTTFGISIDLFSHRKRN